jgi:PTH1 family peptidyl-tRNA hydrolase
MIFVGSWASSVLKAPNVAGKELRVFNHVRDVSKHLNSVLTHGDLVLLKGAVKQDHLVRLFLSHEMGIACWREGCERAMFCTECAFMNVPSVPYGKSFTSEMSELAQSENLVSYPTLELNEQVIVGLGNPEHKYAGTPHNVGYEVVDGLASKLQTNWIEMADAWLARGIWKGKPICLVKVKAPMNLIGFGLFKLSQAMGFGSENCIIVFDDLALPLGVVRTKPNGSAGGHRGVASILEAFQTSALRRVKIGVMPKVDGMNRVEYVLNVFDPVSRRVVDDANSLAQEKILEMAALNITAP